MCSGDLGGIALNLVDQMPHQPVNHLGIVRWKAPHVMRKSRHIIAVNPSKIRHGQPAVLAGKVRVIIHAALYGRSKPLHQCMFAFFRNHHPLAHVSHDFIEEQNDRRAVGFGQVKGIHGHGEYVLMVGCGQCYDGMVPVCAPPGLIHIPLADMGGKPGGWAPALHVYYHRWDLRHDGVAKRFLHQGKAGAAGCGHDLAAGKGCADNGADGGNLIFHLNKPAADLRQPGG